VKVSVEPKYMGSLNQLNGNDSTFCTQSQSDQRATLPVQLSKKIETDMIHQDSKVIPQKCAGDTQSPGTRYNKDLAENSKDCRNDHVEWGWEEWVGRLFF